MGKWKFQSHFSRKYQKKIIDFPSKLKSVDSQTSFINSQNKCATEDFNILDGEFRYFITKRYSTKVAHIYLSHSEKKMFFILKRINLSFRMALFRCSSDSKLC